MLDKKNIPIFIISFNRLKCLKALVFWLEAQGCENINIIDNASTYPALVDYLECSSHKVLRLEENLGHLALFKCQKFDEVIKNNFFILTDPDVVPTADCPDDWLEIFESALVANPDYNKAGFSLLLDDIPVGYKFREQVLKSEKKHWKNSVGNVFKASIDTIFALYRPNTSPENPDWFKGLRCDKPYSARHLGWYSVDLDEEEIFYKQSCRAESTTWSCLHDGVKIEALLGIGALNFVKKYARLSFKYIKNNPNFLFKKEFYLKLKEVLRENS